MKHLGKKLTSVIAAVLAVVMALALAPTAYAAGSGYKLTLTGTATGHTYEAYQIFTGDLSTKEDGTKVLRQVGRGRHLHGHRVCG